MADFSSEEAIEIAQAHTKWRETGSEDARDRLFAMLDSWVRKQAHYMLLRQSGASRQVVNTQTFAQDVLTKLLTSFHRIEYRSLPELLSYILAALRSYLIDLARRRKVQEISLSGVDLMDLAVGNVSTVNGDYTKQIEILTILERIEQVHQQHGIVLQLQLVVGLEHKEIAQHLGISENEVDKMLRHARTKFRHEWHKTVSRPTE